jgi:hypothetical protein
MGKGQKKVILQQPTPVEVSSGNAAIGSPLPPDPTTPPKAVFEVVWPEELVGLQKAYIHLNFNSQLPYVQLKFSFDNRDIRISCDRNFSDDCVFEFEFGESDSRRRSFEIQAVTNAAERNEPIVISCVDLAGKLLGTPEQYWLRLKPAPPPPIPSHWFFDLLRWLWNLSKNRYVRLLILLAAVIGLFSVFHDRILPRNLDDAYTNKLDSVQITLGLRPPHKWENAAGFDPLQSSQGNELDKVSWEAPATWKPIDDHNGRIGLDVIGSELGRIRMPELTSIYDFKALIVMDVTKDQLAASWAFRVQRPGDYYLVKLIFPAPNINQASLECYLYKDGEKLRTLNTNDGRKLDYFPFLEGDVLWININVQKNQFSISVKLVTAQDQRNLAQFVGIEYPKVFTDPNETYKYGTLGFRGEGPNFHMKIEQMNVFEIH